MIAREISNILWDCFSGAEPWSSLDWPVMANCLVDGHDAIVIADIDGVNFVWRTPIGITCNAIMSGREMFSRQEQAIQFLRCLNDTLTSKGLELLGFTLETEE